MFVKVIKMINIQAVKQNLALAIGVIGFNSDGTPRHTNEFSHDEFVIYRACVGAMNTLEAIMQEREPIEPYIQYSEHTGTKWIMCSVCDNPLCKASDDDKPKFCSECGKKVRWE